MAQLQHGKTAEARQSLVVLKNSLDTPREISQRADLTLGSIDDGTAPNLAAVTTAMARAEADAAASRPAAAPRAQPAPADQVRP